MLKFTQKGPHLPLFIGRSRVSILHQAMQLKYRWPWSWTSTYESHVVQGSGNASRIVNFIAYIVYNLSFQCLYRELLAERNVVYVTFTNAYNKYLVRDFFYLKWSGALGFRVNWTLNWNRKNHKTMTKENNSTCYSDIFLII